MWYVVTFVVGMLVGISMKSFQYNTGHKKGYEDAENMLMPIIKNLQEKLAQLENEKKKIINGIYTVKEK